MGIQDGMGFDYAGTTTLAQNMGLLSFSSPSQASFGTGRFGVGYCLQSQFSNNVTKNYPSSTATTVYMGGAFSIVDALGYTNQPILLGVGEIGVGIHAALRIGTGGQLIVTRNQNPTTDNTGIFVDMQNKFIYIEFMLIISDTAGQYIIKVNENTVYTSASNLDTKYGGSGIFNMWYFHNADISGGMLKIDDFYWSDSEFAGDVRVPSLYANGNGFYSQWTGSDADQVDNYLLVDDNPSHDTDSTYVKSNTAGQYDTYTFTDLTTVAGDVKAVITRLIARKDDAGGRTIAPVLRISSTTYDGTTVYLGTDYTLFSQVYTTNPNTAAAWTIAQVNALDAGIKLVA